MLEMDIYLDQQTNRNMVIGSIDKVVTKENHTLLKNVIAKRRKKEDTQTGVEATKLKTRSVIFIDYSEDS